MTVTPVCVDGFSNCLDWIYTRDFIKAVQICIDIFHTIDLQNHNGRTLSFVSIKSFQTLFQHEK
jgi:hypothetical protein